jgi:hypothetical protein
MKAGHENKIDPGNASADLGADPNDFAKRRPDGQVSFGFAVDFTGTASDAPFLVLIYVVATHEIQTPI